MAAVILTGGRPLLKHMEIGQVDGETGIRSELQATAYSVLIKIIEGDIPTGIDEYFIVYTQCKMFHNLIFEIYPKPGTVMRIFKRAFLL